MDPRYTWLLLGIPFLALELRLRCLRSAN